LIRVMCSGRVDLEFVFRAFLNGMDGVFIGGCKFDECNYVTHGNYDAYALTQLGKKLLSTIGLDPQRLRADFLSGADGHLLADYSNQFSETVKALGPLGVGEGLSPEMLKIKLAAVRQLVPYLRLAERERLRVPVKSKEAYAAYFEQDDIDALMDEIVVDKLAVSQILLLLREKPLSTTDISATLAMKPSDVSKHIKRSAKHGMVWYDAASKCYMLAG